MVYDTIFHFLKMDLWFLIWWAMFHYYTTPILPLSSFSWLEETGFFPFLMATIRVLLLQLVHKKSGTKDMGGKGKANKFY